MTDTSEAQLGLEIGSKPEPEKPKSKLRRKLDELAESNAELRDRLRLAQDQNASLIAAVTRMAGKL